MELKLTHSELAALSVLHRHAGFWHTAAGLRMAMPGAQITPMTLVALEKKGLVEPNRACRRKRYRVHSPTFSV